MDWISEHLKFVIIAVFVIGSIVKSLLESKSQGPDGLPKRTDDDAPDRSYRKMPPRVPSVPPPVEWTQIPRSTASESPPAPPLPAAAYTVPGAYEMAQEESARMLKHQQDLAEHLRQIRENKATTSGGAAVTRARVAAGRSTTKLAAVSPLSIRARLNDRAEIRRAFILREILDKPIGLR